MRELELNKEYTYKEICDVFGWIKQSSDSKKAQIKQIESCYEFYHPMNKKTKKPKKSYIFTAKIKDMEEIKHGGAREGAGRKTNMQEEFDIILKCYLHKEFNKNTYFNYVLGYENIFYFSKSSMYKFFGANKDIYGVKDDKNVNKQIYETIMDKYQSQVTTLIWDKVKRNKDIGLSKGIITYKSNNKNSAEVHDEELDTYNRYQSIYLEECKFKSLRDVVKNGQWKEMQNWISDKFEKYDRVICTEKIIYKNDLDLEYDIEKVKEARQSINRFVCDNIISYSKERGKDMNAVLYIVNKYIRLDDNEEYLYEDNVIENDEIDLSFLDDIF